MNQTNLNHLNITLCTTIRFITKCSERNAVVKGGRTVFSCNELGYEASGSHGT